MTEKSIAELCAPVSARTMPEAPQFSLTGRPLDATDMHKIQRKHATFLATKTAEKLRRQRQQKQKQK